MRSTAALVDTGPLVAVFDRRDRSHRRVSETWRTLGASLRTVWPVVTEALYLLRQSRTAVESVFSLLETGALEVLPLERADLPRIRELMQKYSDLPMDFADACLVRVAERQGIRTVFTLDRRGFATYAPRHVRRFGLLPASL